MALRLTTTTNTTTTTKGSTRLHALGRRTAAEHQLRSWLKHERMTVRIVLAEASLLRKFPADAHREQGGKPPPPLSPSPSPPPTHPPSPLPTHHLPLPHTHTHLLPSSSPDTAHPVFQVPSTSTFQFQIRCGNVSEAPDRNRGNQHNSNIAAEATTMQDKH